MKAAFDLGDLSVEAIGGYRAPEIILAPIRPFRLLRFVLPGSRVARSSSDIERGILASARPLAHVWEKQGFLPMHTTFTGSS